MIYYIFYLQGALWVLWRILQHDVSHFTNQDHLALKQTRHHNVLLNCSPTIQMVSGQHSKASCIYIYILYIYIYISMHIPSSISCQIFYALLFRSSIVFGFRWHTRLSQPRPHLLNWHGIRHLAALERWDPKVCLPKIGFFSPKSSIFCWVFHYKPSILGYLYSWKHPYYLVDPRNSPSSL